MVKESNINLGGFDGAYDSNHMATALVDLASQNKRDKPIIAVHDGGRNNIFSLPISEKERDRLIQGAIADNDDIKKELSELSQNAIAKEFDAMFALLEAKKRKVLYTRVIPKDDELLDGVRGRNFSHWILISFFYDHNNKKSILISNPNANEITNSSEIAPISSYLKKNPDVKVYHTRDYLQLDDTFCGPGSLIALRALHKMNEDSFKEILRNGQQRNMGDSGFRYTSIELGYNALQKVIGKVPRLAITKTPKAHEGEKVQDKVDPLRGEIAQVLREVDYGTSQVYCSSNNSIPFSQEFIEGNFTSDQKELSEKYLISGRNLRISQERIQQIEENREKEIEELTERLNVEYSELYKKEASIPVEELVKKLNKKDPELLSILKENKAPIIKRSDLDIEKYSKSHRSPSKPVCVNNSHEQRKPIPSISQTKSKYNNTNIYSTLSGAIIGAAIAYLAGAATLTPLSIAVAAFVVSAAVGALVGYGVAKACEKVSEERAKNSDMGIRTTISNVVDPECFRECSKNRLV